MRGRKPDFDPETDVDAPLELDNRGKRGVALSLEAPGASEVVKRMVAEADIFITNLTAPRIERYDLTWEALKQANPGLIYVVLTGYGTRGPDNAMTAFDYSAFWSRSGIMSLIGEPDGPPMPCRPGQGDHATSLNLLSGTLAALRLRDMTGEGQYVEVTLQRTGAWTIGADVWRRCPEISRKNRSVSADNRCLTRMKRRRSRHASSLPTRSNTGFAGALAQPVGWGWPRRLLDANGPLEHTDELTGACGTIPLQDSEEWRSLSMPSR